MANNFQLQRIYFRLPKGSVYKRGINFLISELRSEQSRSRLYRLSTYIYLELRKKGLYPQSEQIFHLHGGTITLKESLAILVQSSNLHELRSLDPRLSELK